MDDWNFKHKSLTLDELLYEVEHADVTTVPPSGIVIFPPEDEVVTDEDSGEEDDVTIGNLPGAQLRAEAEYEVASDDDKEAIEGNTGDDFDPEDDLPLSSFMKRRKKVKKNYEWKKLDIRSDFLPEWKDDMDNDSSGQTGNISDPVELFFKFIDNDVIDLIVKETNDYASRKNLRGDVNCDEIKSFIGILLLSGYVVLPRRKLYWQNAVDTKNKLVSEAMSRDRFTFVMSNLHCRSNDELDKTDRFSKVRPLFDKINENFQKLAPSQQCHSIDESMVPYFGRHGCKQFIRGKPIRWGYKIWMGTTRLGYIVWFDPYQGKSATIPERYKDFGLGGAVVLQYTDVLLKISGKILPFHLFFDNFFTSLSLLNELSLLGIRGTGTVRENRLCKCPLTENKEFKKKQRGEIEYMSSQEDNIIVCKWNDNNIVCAVSNACPINPVRGVQRFSQKEKKKVNVTQPNTIRIYNENMGGVDRADQNMSLYRISIRGKKWYFPLIAHCIDMAIQNSWQLHRLEGGKMDQLCFRRAVATGILETHQKTAGSSSKSPANLHQHSRYDRLDHLVIFHDKQRRCGVCHKKVNTCCKKCDVALHVKNCFYFYHTKM